MTIDDKIIVQVARLWVELGGDAEGIDWCYRDIKQAVIEVIKEREQSEDDDY